MSHPAGIAIDGMFVTEPPPGFPTWAQQDRYRKRNETYRVIREHCRRADARSSATDHERKKARAWLAKNLHHINFPPDR